MRFPTPFGRHGKERHEDPLGTRRGFRRIGKIAGSDDFEPDAGGFTSARASSTFE
jgi:hypothetical protein